MTRITLLPLTSREPMEGARRSAYRELDAAPTVFEVEITEASEGHVAGYVEAWSAPNWVPVWRFDASMLGVGKSEPVDLSAAGSHRLGSAAVRVSYLVSGAPVTFGVTATREESDHV